MTGKRVVRKWLAIILLLISLILLAWASWPLNRNQQTVPLPPIDAPIVFEMVRSL